MTAAAEHRERIEAHVHRQMCREIESLHAQVNRQRLELHLLNRAIRKRNRQVAKLRGALAVLQLERLQLAAKLFRENTVDLSQYESTAAGPPRGARAPKA